MKNPIGSASGFQASPMAGLQVFISDSKPSAPADFRTEEVGGVWLAADSHLRRMVLRDEAGVEFGLAFGFLYSEFSQDFVGDGDVHLPVRVDSIDDFELRVLPRLAGSFLVFTTGVLPPRLYLDHAGSMPIVYLEAERRAASSASMLLDEDEYRERFLTDLHSALVVREGKGSWISGTLTAHRGLLRLLANHYLDLSSWTVARFWPRPGDFDQWRDFSQASASAAAAIKAFNGAVFRNFRTAATLTAGFDTRLVLAGCRDNLDQCEFFTIAAPHAELDMEMSGRIAERFGLRHRILPLQAADAEETAIWDRVVGDSIIEAPRLTYPTLRSLAEVDAQLTGAFGEVGRCRYYRQDFERINAEKIDARFVLARLTVPQHPALISNVQDWVDGLAGQPNSVILDLALHELKLGSWAMPQRTMMSNVKFSFMPFTQRAVFDAFIGVEPRQKDTETLFWDLIIRLWPELKEFPINKYGDYKDRLSKLRKIFYPNRLKRLMRDRFARKVDA